MRNVSRALARVSLCALPLAGIRYEGFSGPLTRWGNEAQQTASGGLLPQNEESVRVGVSAL